MRRAAATVLSTLLLALSACGAADRTAPAAAARRDWSGGLWVRVAAPGEADVGTIRGDALPLTPAWRTQSNELNRIRDEGGVLPANDSRCIPSGMPFMMLANAVEFLYSPGRIGIIGGSRNFQIRNILLDRPEHTPDAQLFDSYGGESIGHWDGDTLVVDTIGIRSSNEMLYALKGSRLHVVERYTQTAPDTLQLETTVTDPKALAAPWVYLITYRKDPQRFTTESGYCIAAYDRTVDPRTGEQGFDLTPPPEEGVGVPQSLAVPPGSR